MELRKMFVAAILLLLLAATLVVSGCNTWHGAGKDVERTGEKMQGK
jgi:predicted small secreted protein